RDPRYCTPVVSWAASEVIKVELEAAARDLGYRRLYLTTGPRQPEAAGLYLAAGFEPRFDVEADPESIGPLPFVKEIPAELKVAS
ncbi:GNAT family N-acetyltransferase, partial [Kribbella solani]|uniref:GNAT family N-acetyltransferase n=1 Tax=Kribbella solani TaxID=236067 RepID=UPI0029B2AAC2